ncbi:MAG: phage major capsid protein [Actinomycetes bacterium]
MYNDPSTNNANSYSGYEVLNIAPDSPISAAQYKIAQYAAAVTMSGLEMLQNSSKEAIIDLLDGRMQVSEARLLNRISGDLYGDGTGNGGKNVDGLAAAVSATPSSGTYGGINRANWDFWRNQITTGATSVNMLAKMTEAAIKQIRGTDKADLYIAGNNMYQYFVGALQAIQRITTEESGAAGFASLKFYGGGTSADVILGGGIGAQENTNYMYLLNTNYIFFRPHKERNFVPIGGERQAINQDAIVKLYGWAGNLTTSNSQLQGLLTT